QPCDPASYTRSCAGQFYVLFCDPSVNYENLEPCFGGEVCRVNGVGDPVCADPTAATCDPTTFSGRCDDRNTLVSCSGGFESKSDCSNVGGGERCLIGPSGMPGCGVAADCDPASYQANCFGSEAQNCDPMGYVRSQDCGSSINCRVNGNVASCGP